MTRQNLLLDLRNTLFLHSPVPLFVCQDAGQRILGANDAAVTRYGYTRAELRTMTLKDLRSRAPRAGEETTPSRGTPRKTSGLRELHKTRSGDTFEAELHLSTCTYGSRKLLLAAVEEFAQQGEAQQKLAHSAEMLRALVEDCPYGVFRINMATNRLDHVNSALLALCGYDPAEHQTLASLKLQFAPGDRARFLSLLLDDGTVRDFETSLRTKSGDVRRVSLSGKLNSSPETGLKYAQGYVMDVTQQRESDESSSHSQRMEAVGRLAGGIAHDFNNIAQSISLACEIALQKPLPPALESKLLDIMRQTSRAADITRQLLAFSRRQVLQPRVVDLNECIHQVVPLITHTLGLNVALELKLDDSAEHVFVDPHQLTLVLTQLSENARAAMPNGGVLSISTTKCRTGEPCTILTISDTGAGMDERTRRHIFEPFFTTKKDMQATGLGLSTVHGIIAQSKGRIRCTSRPGQGTTFRIELPAAHAHAEEAQPAKDSIVVLLLAEDDATVNKQLAQALEQSGFHVDSVANGEEALSTFDPRRHQLLVTDIMMPRLDGVELTRRLRTRHPDLPVVLISGFSEQSRVLQDLSTQGIRYLQKPFAVLRLVEAIHALLGNAHAPPG
jgi:PAS domain S-box-containing protein